MATREAIISTFRTHLVKNPVIQKGDTIIFFYAGHGSRVSAPADWATVDGQVETLCPHDEWMSDAKGVPIPGIPDRTINALLRTLANEKGTNITVIFDCCHSGGITRNSPSGIRLFPRSLKDPCSISGTLDEDIWMSETARQADQPIADGFRYKAMSSHVLLAACKQEQVAYESRSEGGDACGAFTSALVGRLRQLSLCHATYSDLIDGLPELTNQNPQCEGTNKDNVLFDSQRKEHRKAFKLKEKDGKFEVEAGHIHGVTRGTEFLIQGLRATSLSPTYFGILVAESVNANSSILIRQGVDPELIMPEGTKAVIVNWKNEISVMKVFISPDSSHIQSLNDAFIDKRGKLGEDGEAQFPGYHFTRVSSLSDAHVRLHYDSKGDLLIERMDPLISLEGSKTVCLPMSNRLDRLPYILDAMAQFRFHLGRVNQTLERISSLPGDIHGQVSIHLYRLKISLSGFPVPDMDVGDLFNHNVAKLKLEDNVQYGIEIINHSAHDFFPYLFYFDPSDYSIQSWYLPASSTMSPPLAGLRGKNPSKVYVGYGAGGGDPIEFLLKEDEESDTGFLKLFVSTTYADMEHITQPPVFDTLTSRKAMSKREEIEMWDSWVATITVNRTQVRG
ncbi:hypothetical protein VKT23_008208 [Stygiomarasmius scandens]|uniref:Peptidase C14 caspase domain-containing protein n=1 Tax=Marasmiellus scandens TaxID=2682957 RepID=A0ABR1JHK5_9AGAR